MNRQLVDEASNSELFRPILPSGTGVLVLAGTSSVPERERTALLAEHGALAMALRWFGGPGQKPSPCEVDLEDFAAALDSLAPEVDRLAVLGSSFGAEAALCLGSLLPKIDAIIGIAQRPLLRRCPSSIASFGVRVPSRDGAYPALAPGPVVTVHAGHA